MRGTRNLIITFVFLFIGLFFTSVQMYLHAGSTPVMNLAANLVSSNETEIIAPDKAVIPEKNNRKSFVAMMKRELASRVDKIIVPEPVITESKGEISDKETSVAEFSNREVFWCDATVLEAQFAANWPKEVQVVEREGARVVLASAPSLGTASGTVVQSLATLMQFTAKPEFRTEPACLTNGYIGVTDEGRLIHNNDVVLYRAYTGTTLVGYAFDGNPIYGVVTDDTQLDVCGGQKTSSGYQYHLRSDESFILGCFVSEPQQTIFGG